MDDSNHPNKIEMELTRPNSKCNSIDPEFSKLFCASYDMSPINIFSAAHLQRVKRMPRFGSISSCLSQGQKRSGGLIFINQSAIPMGLFFQ